MCTLELVNSLNWRSIELFLGQIQPSQVSIFPGANVTIYCGSSYPVLWSFRSANNSEIQCFQLKEQTI